MRDRRERRLNPELQNKKQLWFVSFLTSVMNREMPMAARSTSTQFDTCHPYSSGSQKKKDEYTQASVHTHTHTHTRGPSGVFVFLFVSICSESGTWHLLGERAPPMRPPGLSCVWMRPNTHHGKLIKSKGKHNP